MEGVLSKTKGYGQFCPVAKAAEVVAERWTPLVLRELIAGSHRFSDLKRGVPLMSPSLLSLRLKELERAGIVERRPAAAGRGSEYHLTDGGAQLAPLIEQLGHWGQQWLTPEYDAKDLDPSLLMWDIRRRVDISAAPAQPRTTVQFLFSGVASKMARWWLVFERGDVDLCLKDPGHEVDLYVSAPIRVATEVWMGRRKLDRAVRDAELVLDGTVDQVRAFPRWFSLSLFAGGPEGQPEAASR